MKGKREDDKEVNRRWSSDTIKKKKVDVYIAVEWEERDIFTRVFKRDEIRWNFLHTKGEEREKKKKERPLDIFN